MLVHIAGAQVELLTCVTIVERGNAGAQVRRLFRLWRLAGQDLRLLLMALRQRDRPKWLLPASLILAFFALEPFNFTFPLLGAVDDLVLLPLLLHMLVRIAVPSIRAKRDERVVSVQ